MNLQKCSELPLISFIGKYRRNGKEGGGSSTGGFTDDGQQMATKADSWGGVLLPRNMSFYVTYSNQIIFKSGIFHQIENVWILITHSTDQLLHK